MEKEHQGTKNAKLDLERKQDSIAIEHKTELKRPRVSITKLRQQVTEPERTHQELLEDTKARAQTHTKATKDLQAALDHANNARDSDLRNHKREKQDMKDQYEADKLE